MAHVFALVSLSFPKLAQRFGNAGSGETLSPSGAPSRSPTRPETEFRRTRTFPKRCANFRNERREFWAQEEEKSWPPPEPSVTLGGMPIYGDFIDRLFLHEELLARLTPREPVSTELLLRVRAAEDAALSGGRTIGHAGNFALVRGGLFYALDALDEAHAFFQNAPGDLGSYWHGMLHRREGDFDNARYWFRRAGTLPSFGALHRAAAEFSADMAKQSNWDPYLLTGECEQARHGAEEGVAALVRLQRVEFDGVFDYTWRQSGLG